MKQGRFAVWLKLVSVKRFFEHSRISALLWTLKGSPMPARNFTKSRVLMRRFLRQATCIETGTYLGETTKFLARRFPKIITIEPNRELFHFVSNKMKKYTNVNCIFGASEDVLVDAISTLGNNVDVNFWLDGHYSGSFTHLGKNANPISYELAIIEANLHKFNKVIIAIDDFRTFSFKQGNSTPSKDYLVKFASKNSLNWLVEQDIFFMMTLDDLENISGQGTKNNDSEQV
jgi:hypothetical protein